MQVNIEHTDMSLHKKCPKETAASTPGTFPPTLTTLDTYVEVQLLQGRWKQILPQIDLTVPLRDEQVLLFTRDRTCKVSMNQVHLTVPIRTQQVG